MSYEVEIKTQVKDLAAMKLRLDAYVGKIGEKVEKDDVYYAFPGAESPAFRIRRENEDVLITAKQNHREGGEECNREVEFPVALSYLSTCHEMAGILGYTEFIRKHKKGYSWMKGMVHIELLDVDYCGLFLEMEVIVDSPDVKASGFDALYAVLDDLGIAHSAIDPRSYQSMLQRAHNAR